MIATGASWKTTSTSLEKVINPANSARLEVIARGIGDRLLELACHDKQGQPPRANWLSIYLLKDQEWKLLPAGLDLYQGTSGLAFFLAYLGVLSGEKRYQEAVQQALQTVRQQLEDYKKWEKRVNIGGFEGVGSVIYLYAHLAQLWGKRRCWMRLRKLLPGLPIISNVILLLT